MHFPIMEKLRRLVKQIAYTPQSQWLSTLSPIHLSLIPLLSLASALYSVAVRLRRQLYRFNVLRAHRLPVPVISVGNLTWGGNGKTPMAELLARSFAEDGVSPLILTRGYGGGDEVTMLQRQLQGTSTRIGVGANRVATAVRFLEQYGFKSPHATFGEPLSKDGNEIQPRNDEIGVAILDDGMQICVGDLVNFFLPSISEICFEFVVIGISTLGTNRIVVGRGRQHLSLRHNLEIVMVNALKPWGNHCLLPLGPLREPFGALCKADILVIHHADLVQEKDIDALKSTIRKTNKSAPIFFTKMTPMHFFSCRDLSTKLSKMAVGNATVLCLSGIGHADSFIRTIEKMGPTFVDNLDFSDHHLFKLQDLEMVRTRLEALESKLDAKPVVVVTEKDYDRAPEMLGRLENYEVLVLCSRLQFIGSTEDRFRKTAREFLSQRLGV